MSYAVYSEVYFARNFDDRRKIKIGETSNSNRRNNQLNDDNYYITHSYDLKIESARYYVEGFLRFYIEQNYEVERIRKDYFVCKTEQVAEAIEYDFADLVQKAMSIIAFNKQEMLYNPNSTDLIDLLTKHIYDFCVGSINNSNSKNNQAFITLDILEEWGINRYSKMLQEVINKVVLFLKRNYDIVWYGYSNSWITRSGKYGYFIINV